MAKMLDLPAMAVVGLLYVSVELRWGFSWRRTGRGLSLSSASLLLLIGMIFATVVRFPSPARTLIWYTYRLSFLGLGVAP